MVAAASQRRDGVRADSDQRSNVLPRPPRNTSKSVRVERHGAGGACRTAPTEGDGHEIHAADLR